MSLQLLEYDPRGTFSHLLRLPVSSSTSASPQNNNENSENEQDDEEELLYRKTLVGLSPSQKKQRKLWHKAMVRSFNEAISTIDVTDGDENNQAMIIQNFPLLISDLVLDEEKKKSSSNAEDASSSSSSFSSSDDDENNNNDSSSSTSSSMIATVTRFFPCGSIADLISLERSNNGNSNNALPPHEALLVLFKTIQTLDNLHSLGIGHGNLKLENILLDETGKFFFTDAAGTATATPNTIKENSIDIDIQQGLPSCVLRLLNGAFGDLEFDFISCCKSGEFGCDRLLQHALFVDTPELTESFSSEEEIMMTLSKLANRSFQLRRPYLMAEQDDDEEDEDEDENVSSEDEKARKTSLGLVSSSKRSPPKITSLSLLRNTITTASYSASHSLLIGSHPAFGLIESEHHQRNSNDNNNDTSSSSSSSVFPSLTTLIQELQQQQQSSSSPSSSSPSLTIEHQHPSNPHLTTIRISNLLGAKLHVSAFPYEFAKEFIIQEEENEENENDENSSSLMGKIINPMISFIQLHRDLMMNPQRHFLWILENCEQSNIILNDVGGSNSTVVVQNSENCWMRFGPTLHLAVFDCNNSDIGAPCQFSSFQRCQGLNLRTLSPRCAEEVQQHEQKQKEELSSSSINNNVGVRHLLFDCALPMFFAARCRFSGMPVLSSFLPPEVRQQQQSSLLLEQQQLAKRWLNQTNQNFNFWLMKEWGRKPNHLQLPSFLMSTTTNDGSSNSNNNNNNNNTLNGNDKVFHPFALEISNNNKSNNINNKEQSNTNTSSEFNKCSFPLLIPKSAISHDVTVEGNLFIGPDEATKSSISVVQTSNNDNNDNEEEEATDDECHAVAIFEWIMSAQISNLRHAIIVICSASEFVSIENCFNCDIYVVSARLRVDSCEHCRIFAYTSLEPPVCMNSENVIFSEFCLKLPNLTMMASLTCSSNNNNNQESHHHDDTNNLRHSLTHSVHFVNDDDNNEDSSTSSCQYHRGSPALLFSKGIIGFDPTLIMKAISATASNNNNNSNNDDENDGDEDDEEENYNNDNVISSDEYLLGISPNFTPKMANSEMDHIFANANNKFFPVNNNPQTKSLFGHTAWNNFCNHYSIHDNSNAAIDRMRNSTSLLPQQQEQEQNNNNNNNNNLLRFDIFCVDCGHIQITEPLQSLRISHCRGGPLTVVAPFVQGDIIIDNCANLTLMAACSGELQVIGNSSFCEVSILANRRPVISSTCRSIELSPFNLSAQDLESTFEQLGIDFSEQSVRLYEFPRVIQDADDSFDEVEEIPVKLLNLDNSLCPIFHLSPPLLGVSIQHVNNNIDHEKKNKTASSPFIAEISDGVDEAANKNEPLQAFLVERLMNFVPGLFKSDDEKNETEADNNNNDDIAATNEDAQQASALLKMLRKQKEQDNNNNINNSEQDDEAREVHDNNNNSNLFDQNRPMSAMGRSRPNAGEGEENNNNNNNNNTTTTCSTTTNKKALISTLESIFDKLVVESGIKKVVISQQQQGEERGNRNDFDESDDEEEIDTPTNQKIQQQKNKKEDDDDDDQFPAPPSPDKSQNERNEEWKRQIMGDGSSSSDDQEEEEEEKETKQKEEVPAEDKVDETASVEKKEQEQQQQPGSSARSFSSTTSSAPSTPPAETEEQHQQQIQQEEEISSSSQSKQETIKALESIFSSIVNKETVDSMITNDIVKKSSSNNTTEDKSDTNSPKKPRPKPKRAPMAAKAVVAVEEEVPEKSESPDLPSSTPPKTAPTAIIPKLFNIPPRKNEVEFEKNDNDDKNDDDNNSNNNNSISNNETTTTKVTNNKSVGSLVGEFLDNDDDSSCSSSSEETKEADQEQQQQQEPIQNNETKSPFTPNEQMENNNAASKVAIVAVEYDEDPQHQQADRNKRYSFSTLGIEDDDGGGHDEFDDSEGGGAVFVENQGLGGSLSELSDEEVTATAGSTSAGISPGEEKQQQQHQPENNDLQQQQPSTATLTLSQIRRPPALTALILPGSEEAAKKEQEQQQQKKQQQAESTINVGANSNNNSNENRITSPGLLPFTDETSPAIRAIDSPSVRSAFKKMIDRETATKAKKDAPDPSIVASLVCRSCSDETLREMVAMIFHQSKKPSSGGNKNNEETNNSNDSTNSDEKKNLFAAASLWAAQHEHTVARNLAKMKIENASHHRQIPSIMKIAANGVDSVKNENPHTAPTSSIVSPGMAMRPMTNNFSTSKNNVFKGANNNSNNNNPNKKSTSNSSSNKNEFDDDDDDFDDEIQNTNGGKLQDDFANASSSRRNSNNKHNMMINNNGGYDDGFDDENENDGIGGNFWTIRDTSTLNIENQGPSRDRTLSALCFDKKIDDKLAALRNKVLANAGKIQGQYESVGVAMQQLHMAVKGAKGSDPNSSSKRPVASL